MTTHIVPYTPWLLNAEIAVCVSLQVPHTGLREWRVQCVFEVSGRVYTHSSVLRAAGLCGQRYIWLAPADPTGSPHSWSSRAGAYNKQAWRQTWNSLLCQHTNCPLADRVRDQQAGKEAATNHHPLPFCISSTNWTTAQRGQDAANR